MGQERQVTIDLEGRVVCPAHGRLGPDAEYEPGRAECGCEFAEIGHTGILERLVDNTTDDGNKRAADSGIPAG